MSNRPGPSVYEARYICIALYAIAVAATVLRLYLRSKVRVWWWDDSLALFSGVSMSFFLVPALTFTERAFSPPKVFYPIVLGYYLAIWSARLSILFTIIRFAPLASQRRALGYLAGTMVIQCMFLLIEAVWYYKRDARNWNGYIGDQPVVISVSQISTTMITDTLLVLAPIMILRSARLDPGLHRRLVAAVSISAVATFCSVMHIVIVLTVGGMWGSLSGLAEVFVYLFVCNTYVMVLSIMVRAAQHNRSAITDGIYISTAILEDISPQGSTWLAMHSPLEENRSSKS